MVHMFDGVFLPSLKHNVAICCFCLEALGDLKVMFEHPGEGEGSFCRTLRVESGGQVWTRKSVSACVRWSR